MDLCSISDIRAIMSRYGFTFKKGLGQNFLIDGSVPVNIAEGAGIEEGFSVLEVGPGIGALTVRLADIADRVVAVEIDERLFPILRETTGGKSNVEIVKGDILKTDLRALCADFGGRAVACANLPYYITTPAVIALLECGCFRQVTVMVQKEVALRMCARPGTADYGAFSLFVQYYSAPEVLFEVPSSSFVPQPKVDSAVVAMKMLPEPPVSAPKDAFFKTVRAAFSQRRKTLLNSLSGGLGLDRDAVSAALEKAGIPAGVRGETLDMYAFSNLAQILFRI